MRILFIHEVNYLRKPIFEMHEFPEYLAARGHEIFFLHLPEGSSRSERFSVPWLTKIQGRAVSDAQLNLMSPRVPTAGILGRLYAAIRGHSIVKRAIRDSAPDLVVTLAVPTFGWQAVRVAKRFNLPVVYRALDVSHKIRNGAWGPLVKIAERYVVRSCESISANNPAMAEYITELAGRKVDVATHYPFMKLEDFEKGDFGRGRKALGVPEEDFLIVYMGSFFSFSGLPEILREFARTYRPANRVKLVLLGGGEQDRELRTMARDPGLRESVIFTGFVDFQSLPDFLKAADVLINPMKREFVSEYALPNKVLQYLMTGNHVVSTDLKGLRASLAGFENVHWTESSEECLHVAFKLQGQPAPSLTEKNRQALEKTFGAHAIDNFESHLKNIAGK